MNEKITGINFGVGVFETKKGYDDEKIKAVVESIEKETKDAGLPWWAGMFNPKIVELAEIKRGECKCGEPEEEGNSRGDVAKEPEETPEEKQFREMEEQRERIRRADELVIDAIRAEVTSMEKLEELLKSTDTKSPLALEIARNIAGTGESVARLRSSMNSVPFYGYAV